MMIEGDVPLGTNWKGFRVLFWALVPFMAALTVWTAMRSDAQNGLGMACVLVGGYVLAIVLPELPTFFQLVIVLTGLVEAGAFFYDMPDKFTLYDKLQHALMSLSTGSVLGYYVIGQLRDLLPDRKRYLLLFVFCITLSVGAAWEVLEFYLYTYVDPEMIQRYGRADTVTDLIADAAGSAVAAWLVIASLKAPLRAR
jgi:hypothetical protein